MCIWCLCISDVIFIFVPFITFFISSIFEANPKISTSIIAFVFFVIFLTSSAEMQNLIVYISKTGIQFQCNIAVAVAHIVHGETMISSPGSTSKLPIIAIKPEVQEFTQIACLVL